MKNIIRIKGRDLCPDDIRYIEDQIAKHPEWHRTRLSREICAAWNWKDDLGRLKDMASRTMLLKLERKGLLKLPPRRINNRNQFRGKAFKPLDHDSSALHTTLHTIQPVELICSDRGNEARLWRTLMVKYHYLGFKTRVGQNIITSLKPALEGP